MLHRQAEDITFNYFRHRILAYCFYNRNSLYLTNTIFWTNDDSTRLVNMESNKIKVFLRTNNISDISTYKQRSNAENWEVAVVVKLH
jgi:hypothetical protein